MSTIGSPLLCSWASFYACAHFYDLPPKLFKFALDYSDYEVDDVVTAIFMLSIALMIFAWRRVRELANEIKARRAAEEVARKMARHDPLTGLPNRRYFNEKLDEALANVVADRHRAAVLMLDLDGFKAINDVHGHLVGDKALTECAERITAAAKGALVARVGGDEFSIVMPKINSLDEPAGLARRIAKAVAEPFQIADTETALGVGIGIAVAPDDGTTADDLVRRADLALYRAKAEGRSFTRFFEPAMDAHVERRTTIERELRAAIADAKHRGALPAAGPSRRRPHHRLRGAGALDQPDARRRVPQRVHCRSRKNAASSTGSATSCCAPPAATP